jgi:hypothetical protein
MKIKEYIDRLNKVEKFEHAQPPPENYKLVVGTDVFGGAAEYRVRILQKRLPLGTGNLFEHRHKNFKIEQQKISNEKQRLGLSQKD